MAIHELNHELARTGLAVLRSRIRAARVPQARLHNLRLNRDPR